MALRISLTFARQLLAFALLAPCSAGAQRGEPTSRHVSISPEQGGPLLMALGDTLRVLAQMYDCYYDVCLLNPGIGRRAWTAGSPGIVIRNGVIHTTREGVFTVSVVLLELKATDSVRVLPAVKDLSWSHRPSTIFVGDTLRTGLLARDSLGRVVHRFGATKHLGRSGEIVWWDRDGQTGLFINRPGTIKLVGSLAHRADTLTVEALERRR